MSEPRPDDVDPALLSDELPSPDALRRKQRTRMLLMGLVLLGAVAAIAFYVYREATKVELVPNKVVVLIDAVDGQGNTYAWWLGSDEGEVSRAWSGLVAEELEGLGLEAVENSSESREALAEASDADALREAARELGAAYVVRGTLRTVRPMPWSSTDMQGFVYELDLEVLDADEAAGSVDVLETPVRFIAAARSESDALKLPADAVGARVYLPHLARALVERPGLQRIKKGGDEVSLEDKEIANELEKKLFLYAEDWGRRVKERDADVKSAEQALVSDEQSSHPRQVLGGYVAQEDIIGTRDGQVILLNEIIQLGFDWPPGEVVGDVTIEQLVRADAQGGAREIVLEHDNFYSTPSVSSNGRWAIFVLAQRSTKTLGRLDLETGAFDALAVVTGSYFGSPSISDDGRYAFAFAYPRQRAAESLEVIDAETRERLEVLPAGAWFGYPSWVPGEAAFYVAARFEGELVASLYRYDIPEARLSPVLGAAADAERAFAEANAGALAGPGPEVAALGPDGVAAPDGEGNAGTDGEAGVDGVDAPEPPEPPDFRSVVVSPTGGFAIVEEQAEGSRHLGRFDLETRAYERIREIDAEFVRISPDGKWLAMQLEGHGDSRDPARGDNEIAVMPIEGGELRMLTLNSTEDYLRQWSKDGTAVYATQYSSDPTWGRRRMLSRVFRIGLEAKKP